jgi:hypothetical protein
MFDSDWGALLFWAIHIGLSVRFSCFRTAGTTQRPKETQKEKATKSCRQTRARRYSILLLVCFWVLCWRETQLQLLLLRHGF